MLLLKSFMKDIINYLYTLPQQMKSLRSAVDEERKIKDSDASEIVFWLKKADKSDDYDERMNGLEVQSCRATKSSLNTNAHGLA